MIFDNLLGNPQTKAGAYIALGGVEGFIDLRHSALRDPDAVVSDGDSDTSQFAVLGSLPA